MIDDMREKIYLATRTFKLIFLASVFVAISFLPIAAQVPKASVKDQILPPSQEKFQERDQLVSPWRESGTAPRAKEDRDLPEFAECATD